MGSSRIYLGLGSQRKGENLDQIIISWVYYQIEDGKLILRFEGKDCKNLSQAVEVCHEKTKRAQFFNLYYSVRGIGFYLKQVWERQIGLLSTEKGLLVPYEEDKQDLLDTRATLLAADIDKLRQTEQEWPRKQLIFNQRYTRRYLHRNEASDDPGRGPLRKMLTRVQEQHGTDYVPTSAMALQAVRRAWAASDDLLEEHGDLPPLEAKSGLLISQTKSMRKKRQAAHPPMPDPQTAFASDDGDFIDYEGQEQTGLY